MAGWRASGCSIPRSSRSVYSDLELVVSASNDSIVMVEGGALEVSETDVLDALTVAQKGVRELIAAQEELLSKAGRAAEDGVDQGRSARGIWSRA